MKLDGLVLSVIIQSKEQYENSEAGGSIASIPLEGFGHYNNDIESEQYNVQEINEKMQALTNGMVMRLIDHYHEKQKEK